MAYKASMQERFHRNFNSRIRTDENTLIRTTGIAANLEALYLFNGGERARPSVVSNLKQDTHHIDMTWNGDGYLLGDGGIKLADNGNAVLNTAGLVRDIDANWSGSKEGKSRVFVVNLEWKAQSISQCYIIDSNGFRFFRSATGTVFTISMENQSTHRAAWTIDTIAFKDGDPVTIVVCGDYSTNTSVCYINGVSLGAGTFNGYPFAPGVSARPANMNSIGRTSSWNNYYGFDGKIGLYGFSFEFLGNVPPTNAELKALSIDPYRVLLNTQRSKIDLPDILLPAASDWEIEFEARCDILPTNDNLIPLLTATDYAPNTQKGLSLQAAGNTAYGTIPGWVCQYGTGSRWSVEVEFELTELSNVIHLLGASAASASILSEFLCIEINGVIGVRNSGSLILQSTPGSIQANKRYFVKVAKEDDTLAKLYIDDMITPVATCPIADIPTIDTDQIGRYSTTTYTPTFILYRLKFSNDSGMGSGPKYYSAEWNLSTIPSDDLALNWPSVGATHNITITNPTVGIDPYYTKTPYMAGLFTNSAGQLIWAEGANNYTTGGFAIATLWSGNSTRYLAMPFWAGAAASVWSLETEFMIYENNVGGFAWAFGIFTNNLNGFLAGRFVDASQTSFYIEAKDSAGNVVATTPNLPFVLGKWYKVKIESTNADWVITVDDMEQVRVPSTIATPSIARLLGTTITPIVKVACRSLVTSGGTYSATWNTSNTNGKGSVWTSTNGQMAITHYGTYSNAYNWYDLLRCRFISESDAVIPQERHIYKISKVGSTFTVSRDYTQPVVVAWTQTKDVYINRVANVSANGIEYGNNLQIYSLRVGTEIWTPTATDFASSVNSIRNAVLSGTSLANIPDPYVYCPANGQTYTSLAVIPQAAINLNNVVFEVSGFIRDTATVRWAQSPQSSITVRAVAGQEFVGNLYDDAVATAMFCNEVASYGGLCYPNSSTGILNVSGLILTSNQTSSTGVMAGVVGTSSSATGQTLNLSNLGVLSHYGMARSINFNGAGNTITINNVISIGSVCAGEGSVTASRLTSVNTHPTSTGVSAISGSPMLTDTIAIKPLQSTSVAVSGTFNSVATNDVTGTYGLFASLNDFVDPKYGDYRLKPESGLYKAGIGAFSPDYASPTTVYAETTGVLLSTPTMYGPYSYAKYVIDTSDDFSGSFSTSILVDASITLFSKESAVTKPDTSSNVDLIMALAKEIGVAKSAISANFNIAATAAKEAGPSKPDTQINTDIAGLAATKEALTAITLLANISTSYLYQIIYDIGGAFSSLITVSTSKASTKSVNSVKAGTVANIDVSGIGAAKIANSTKQNVSASSDFVIGSGNKTPLASKPSTQVNVDALAAAVKDVGTVKINSSVLADIMSLVSKEVGYQKPATSANVDFASFLYEISYGITGSFTSVVLASLVLQATKEALSQKTASSGRFSGIKVATKESSSQKPVSNASFSTSKISTKAINSGMYSEISTSTQYNWTREAFSGIFTEISLSWEIFGTAKDIAKQIVLIDSDYQRVFEFFVNEVTKFNIDGDSTAYSLEYTTEGKINYLSYVGEDSQQTVTYTTKESKCLQ